MTDGDDAVYRLKADAAYFQAIEDHFRALRATHLFLTPRDNPLIDAWWEAGIPVEVVRRALDGVFRRRREAGEALPVVSLRYCRHAVEEAFREWQESRVGGPSGAPAASPGPADAASFLRGCAEDLRATERRSTGGAAAALQAARAEVEDLAARLDGAEPPTLAAAEVELEATEERLVGRLLDGLDPEARRALQERAIADVGALRARLTARAFDGRLRLRLRAELREQWQLPRLTLYFL